jgi:5-methylcytosine-specific restriction protein A
MEWFNIHDELNKALISHYKKYKENSGKELFKKFKKYEQESKQILPFTKKFFSKNSNNTKSFDPIHIYAAINYYGISTNTRKIRLVFLYKVLDINVKSIKKISYEDVFYTYPHLNITHIVAMRANHIQQDIWKFFYALCNMNIPQIKDLFDTALSEWYGIKMPSLTVFMFWLNSSKFIPMDQYTVKYLEENFIIEQIPKSYEEYHNINSLFQDYSKDIYRSVACLALNKKIDELTLHNKKEVGVLNNYYKNKYKKIKDINALNNDFSNQVRKSLEEDPEKRRNKLKNATKKPTKSRMTIKYYKRNPDVVAEVLYRANGICECCHKKAPFKRRKDGSYYLEVHHKKQLSQGGLDSVENAEALCPNCHREKHFGENY